jgi:nucleotide-binding universal stress UspA family protein
VHAVPCSFGERSVDLAGAVAHGRRLLDAAAAHAEALRAGLVPNTQLLRVRPHELVGEALDADLLVVGGPRTGPRTDHPGSVQPGGLSLVAHSALHHAPCPVLLTPR